MSPEKQRIAIAEWCGVKPRRVGYYVKHPTEDRLVIALDTFNECAKWLDDLPESSEYKHWLIVPDERYPDYCNDLNAMHEAVKTINSSWMKYSDYIAALRKIVAIENSSSDNCTPPYCSEVDATAAQRAEALLRTIGKWEE